jgi:hypothetical protein
VHLWGEKLGPIAVSFALAECGKGLVGLSKDSANAQASCSTPYLLLDTVLGGGNC